MKNLFLLIGLIVAFVPLSGCGGNESVVAEVPAETPEQVKARLDAEQASRDAYLAAEKERLNQSGGN